MTNININGEKATKTLFNSNFSSLFVSSLCLQNFFAIKIVTNKETIDPKTAGNSGPKNFATRT